MRNNTLIIIFQVVFGLVSCSGQSSSNKPNVVFIFSDDLSFRDLSSYGQKTYSTPNLDALAATSTRYTQAYTPAPECAPSRGCMLTGKHVGRSPIRINSSARGFEYLPDSAYTFAEMFQENGYKTAVIGKWGLGYHDTEGNPNKQGFDYHFGYLTHYEAHSYFPLNLYENGKSIVYPGNEAFPMELQYEKERNPEVYDWRSFYDADGKLKYAQQKNAVYTPDILDQKLAGFIDKNRNKPFLLYFTTNLPHGPSIVDDFRQLKSRNDMDIRSQEWGAMVERLDISVGKLISKLKEDGLYENTMIVFASDNGYAMHNPYKDENGKQIWPDDPFLENKGPFLGGKFSVNEAGMRVPMFVKFPHQQKAEVISQAVWILDLFPTFAELIGVSKPVGLDGFSLFEVEKGKVESNRPMYFYKNNEQAVRKGAWYAHRSHPNEAIKLYLLEEDQKCEKDLAAFYPKVAKSITEYLDHIHEPHPWYWNPGETAADFKAKQKKAKELGQEIKRYRPNHMELMPWEIKAGE